MIRLMMIRLMMHQVDDDQVDDDQVDDDQVDVIYSRARACMYVHVCMCVVHRMQWPFSVQHTQKSVILSGKA